MLPKTNSIGQPNAEDVGRLVRSAASWAFVLLIARQVVTIGTTMIVSRHVTPAAVGSVGMVMTFIAFIVLIDTGLTWATVQAHEISKQQIDELFWFGALLGAALWVTCWAVGPLLAEFYRNPEVGDICLIMGLVPFLNSLTTQPAALLKRELRQKVTNSIDTTATIVSSVVAVVLAVYDFGYWSIVCQTIAVPLVRLPLLFYCSDYRLGCFRATLRCLPQLRVAFGLALSNFVCYFQLYLGSILVGRAFGNVALGNYLKAYGVKSLPTSYATMVVTDVMISALAALRTDPARMSAAYRKALTATAFVGCPAGALLFPMAPEIVRLLYGPQWHDAVPLLRCFAFPAIVLPISTTTIWLFIASGSVREQLLMNCGLTLLGLLFFLVGMQFATTVQDLVIVEAFLLTLPFPLANLYFSHKAVRLNLRLTLEAIMPIVFISVLCASGAALMGTLWADLPWEVLLLVKAATGSIIYLYLAATFVQPLPIPWLGSFLTKRVF